MIRVLLRLSVAIVLSAILAYPLIPALIPQTTSVVRDSVTITNYRANFVVDHSGAMDVTEEITAEFPPRRHGIFRYWDVADFVDPSIRYRPKDLVVQLNGGPVPTSNSWNKGRRYLVAKIGDPDRELAPGEHTFSISYHIDGVIAPSSVNSPMSSWSESTDISQFVWQVIPAGWTMPIERADITVLLPTTAVELECQIGSGIAAVACSPDSIAGSDSESITITTDPLEPGTAVTFRAAIEQAAPKRTHVPWSVTYDPVLGTNWLVSALLAILGLTAFVIGYLCDRSTRESRPGYPVVFQPPDGLGPVQTVFVKLETIPARATTATLLHLAELGYISMEQTTRSSWVITGLVHQESWSAVDPVSAATARHLGIDQPGAVFSADGSAEAGRVLQALDSEIEKSTRQWGRESGATVQSIREIVLRVFWPASVIVLIGGIFLGLTSIYLAPFAGFTIGGVGLMLPGVGVRRTNYGRQLWSAAGGFWRFLSTEAAKDRFDFSGRSDIYIANIPYAVAFDCAERWATKYEEATGLTAPAPQWYPANAPRQGSGLFSRGAAFSSFEGALAASISAYTAAQRSSSGSGGSRFSGGGGGGGGGSW